MRKLYFLTAVILFTGVFANAQIRLNVMRPAIVDLGSEIGQIAIIDRTEPEKQWVGVLEGIATGEGIGLDKEGRSYVISGLSGILNESPKYSVVAVPVVLKTPLVVGALPEPLPWHEVEKYCKQYNSDALLSLEFFDSDFIVTKSEKTEEVKDKDGKVVKKKIYYAEGVGSVKIGYRVYDYKNKNIIDQYTDTRSNSWSTSGSSPQQAMASLISRRNAIMDISRNSGILYAERISPHWITVYRYYYRKPKKKDLNFITGVRKAQTDNWEGALEDWNTSSKSDRKKVASRSMYNAALAYEVLGNLEAAKKMASDAYTIYGLKKARNYVSVIENRIWQEQRLDEQLP